MLGNSILLLKYTFLTVFYNKLSIDPGTFGSPSFGLELKRITEGLQRSGLEFIGSDGVADCDPAKQFVCSYLEE